MSVTISGTTGISIGGSNVATDADLAALVTGKVLQTLSTAKTDVFTTSATTPTDVTGLTVSITPSDATSKILVIVQLNISGTSTNGHGSYAQLVRNSTALAIGDTAGTRTRASVATARRVTGWTPEAGIFGAPIVWLDSPNATSATVYKIQAWAASGSTAVNRWASDADGSNYPSLASTITVMEIAA